MPAMSLVGMRWFWPGTSRVNKPFYDLILYNPEQTNLDHKIINMTSLLSRKSIWSKCAMNSITRQHAVSSLGSYLKICAFLEWGSVDFVLIQTGVNLLFMFLSPILQSKAAIIYVGNQWLIVFTPIKFPLIFIEQFRKERLYNSSTAIFSMDHW